MDYRAHKTAVLANLAKYRSETMCKDLDGAPPPEHSALRNLYAELVGRVFDWAATHNSTPQVLDLGAGEGSATLPLLEFGAQVTAVDISENQRRALLIELKSLGVQIVLGEQAPSGPELQIAVGGPRAEIAVSQRVAYLDQLITAFGAKEQALVEGREAISEELRGRRPNSKGHRQNWIA